jgi:hypothetical protein
MSPNEPVPNADLDGLPSLAHKTNLHRGCQPRHRSLPHHSLTLDLQLRVMTPRKVGLQAKASVSVRRTRRRGRTRVSEVQRLNIRSRPRVRKPRLRSARVPGPKADRPLQVSLRRRNRPRPTAARPQSEHLHRSGINPSLRLKASRIPNPRSRAIQRVVGTMGPRARSVPLLLFPALPLPLLLPLPHHQLLTTSHPPTQGRRNK